MTETRRTEKISAVLTPELAARLGEFADSHRWSLSTAVAVLVEEGISADPCYGDGGEAA